MAPKNSGLINDSLHLWGGLSRTLVPLPLRPPEDPPEKSHLDDPAPNSHERTSHVTSTIRDPSSRRDSLRIAPPPPPPPASLPSDDAASSRTCPTKLESAAIDDPSAASSPLRRGSAATDRSSSLPLSKTRWDMRWNSRGRLYRADEEFPPENSPTRRERNDADMAAAYCFRCCCCGCCVAVVGCCCRSKGDASSEFRWANSSCASSAPRNRRMFGVNWFDTRDSR
mmetsp:Transcript_11201/g.24252  ORF Transcript_11201/g.24252 Transcript_11201/m.24252 type:complete len:226 (-) Transcript_11201:656-1333(-)